MKRPAIALVLTLACGALGAACATPYAHGRSAFLRGDYVEAASRFEEALADRPARLDALVGLGISRYKFGAWAEAKDALGRVVMRAPKHLEARLYLGLASLRSGDIAGAEEHLTEFRDLRQDPRITAQTDRALRLLRGDPLPEEMIQFVAASLEDEATLVRELDAARAAARADPSPLYRRAVYCTPARHGRLICF